MTKADKASNKLETLHLKVFIHCEGCRRKIKKLLYSVDGVEAITIDSETGKASVTGTADAKSLLQRLAKANKQAEIWSSSNNGGEKGAVFDSQAKPKGNNADKDDKKKEQVKEKKAPEGADKSKEEATKESKAKGIAGNGGNSKGGNTKEGADKSKEEASKENKAKGSAGSNGGNCKGGNEKKDGGVSADNAGKKGGNKKPNSSTDSKRVTFEGDANGEGKKGSTVEGVNTPHGEAPWKGNSQEEWQESTSAGDNSGQAKKSPNDGKKNNAKVKQNEGDNAVIEIAAGDRSHPLSHRTMAPLDSTRTSYSLQSAEYATHMFSDENANNCRIM